MSVLTEEDIEFLRELAIELKTQDTACTAKPVYIQVRQKVHIIGINPDYADELVLLMGDDYAECYRVEDAKEWLLDTGSYSDGDLSELQTLEDIHDFCDTEGTYNTILTGYREDEEFEGCFLTRRGYEQHMELNRHNYRHRKSPPEPFVQHAFRNPELERLLSIVEKFADVEKEANTP